MVTAKDLLLEAEDKSAEAEMLGADASRYQDIGWVVGAKAKLYQARVFRDEASTLRKSALILAQRQNTGARAMHQSEISAWAVLTRQH